MSSTQTAESTRNRNDRYRTIIPPEKLDEILPIVIGVGAVGRQIALQLSAIGVKNLMTIDHDTVEIENLGPQGYLPVDCGISKVVATAKMCGMMNPDGRLYPRFSRFKRTMPEEWLQESKLPKAAIFNAVDSIETRGAIWDSVKESAAFYVDGRMSGEVIRVLASSEPLTDQYYTSTLFTAEEAHQGACTAKSTIYTASIAAGLMIGQFTKWIRGLPVERDTILNLISMEMVQQ